MNHTFHKSYESYIFDLSPPFNKTPGLLIHKSVHEPSAYYDPLLFGTAEHSAVSRAILWGTGTLILHFEALSLDFSLLPKTGFKQKRLSFQV